MPDDFKDDDYSLSSDPQFAATAQDVTEKSSAPTWVNQPSVNVSRPTSPPTVQATPYYYSESRLPPPPPLVRESAARARMRRRRVKGHHQGGEWAWVIIAGAMLGVVIIISMSFFLLLRTSQDKIEILPTAGAALPTPVDARSSFDGSNTLASGQLITLDDGRSLVLEPWDGQSRFTVLVMGLDRRPGETGLAYRTDTMMLVSIDPNSKTLGMLSIPRDLYVQVPGYSQLQRINSPMVLGEIRQVGYGPTLAMQTVQLNFGMRVHDYLAVDFNAFVGVVDAIGGIDVDVPYTISDPQYPDMYFGYDPFYIRAGLQHLDGKTSLKYARTRHGDSDFERAKRQQQVLYAIRDRVLNLNMLPQLIVQAPTLWSTFKENVYTRLSMDQIIQLVWYLKDIQPENMKTGVVDASYTMPWTTPDGASVLIPDRARLGPLMVEIFGANYSE